MNLIDLIINIFGIYPSWANVLECKICKTSFISPRVHYEHVIGKH